MPERVAIIGAGASGIAAARQALDYGFEPVVFEKSDDIGGLWRFTDNPNVRSVAFSTTSLDSKELAAFSDFPPPDHFSTFMHHTEMLLYLQAYVERFKLRPHIHVNHLVLGVRRAEDWQESGKWLVSVRDSAGQERTESFDAVLLATGMHARPGRPFEYRMETEFHGRISHASQFKSPEGFRDKSVLLVGFGNSAVQCAVDLAPVARKVYLSTRHGSWLLPLTETDGTPWDWRYNSRLHALARRVVPKFARNLLWEVFLNARIDHTAAGLRPEHKFLAAHPTFARSGFHELLLAGRVQIVPNLLSFTETGVELVDKTVLECVDEVIFCTGFYFDMNLVEDGKLIFVRENDFHLYKHIFLPELSDLAPQHNNLGVLGHVQPWGPFLPVVEMQARFFFDVLSKNYELKSPLLMRASLEEKRCQMSLEYVKTKRHTQIEDYTEYMDDLASKIGAKPSFLSLLRTQPLVAWHLLTGPTLSYQYRLEGSHTWSEASNAILTSSSRRYPHGRSRHWKPWHIALFLYGTLLLWLLFW